MSEPPRQLLRPEVGFWMVKQVRGGPEVPARIFYSDHEPGIPENKVDQPYMDAEIGGKRVSPDEVWHRRGRRITAAEFSFQIADSLHAKEHRPDDPKAEPKKPIDLMRAPTPF